jgi:hypothetical protein
MPSKPTPVILSIGNNNYRQRTLNDTTTLKPVIDLLLNIYDR